jgi:hypothetical protein
MQTSMLPAVPRGEPIYLDDLRAFVATGVAAPGESFDFNTRPNLWTFVEQLHGPHRSQALLCDFKGAAPPLSFTCNARGWHSIHIGQYGSHAVGETGLYVRVAGEPHFTRLEPTRREPCVHEAFYKHVLLNGPTEIQIASFGLRGGLSHVKLTPVNEPQAPPKQGRSWAICDFIVTAGMNRPSGFEAGSCLRQHHDAGYDAILWKAFKVVCEYHSAIGVRRDMGLGYDSLRQAADEAQKVGIDLYPWMRFNNEDSKAGSLFNPTTPFHLANPHVRQQRKDGYVRPRSGYAHPEARQFKASLVGEVASYGVRGVCIDVLRHPPVAEYEPILVDAFIARTGQDPRQMPGDGSMEWLKFRCEAFTQFLRDCRAAIADQRSPDGRPLQLIVRTLDQPWRNLQCGCDVEAWVDEGLVDGLIFAAHLAPPDFFPQRLDLTPYLALTRGRVPVYGQVWNCGSPIEADVLAGDLYRQGVQGIVFYESEESVVRPLVREHLWRFNRPSSLRYRPA